jgi:dTDP-glucose pyrophosphorylase
MLGNVVACLLAGGEGKRLRPLTAHRAKPAVRFGGSYHLIDFPLSNCINSAIHRILIFPQYKAHSLERYLREGWGVVCKDLDAYVLSMPPPQFVGQRWYRGTADAVYQNLNLLERMAPDYVLILASDHVYRMDYRSLLRSHQERHADVSVATFAVPRWQACRFGIVTADQSGDITSFREKPTDLCTPASGLGTLLASMGIYVFTLRLRCFGEYCRRMPGYPLITTLAAISCRACLTAIGWWRFHSWRVSVKSLPTGETWVPSMPIGKHTWICSARSHSSAWISLSGHCTWFRCISLPPSSAPH